MAYNFTDKNGLLYVITKIKNLLSNCLDKAGDSKDNTVTFTSGDSTNPTGWANINIVESGETHASLFRKFSLAVKNLRYLYKMLGSTDISSIGDGTATGAIATLNSNLNNKADSNHTHSYLPLSGGALTGNVSLKETNNILLRPSNNTWTTGIGHDTHGDECIALWAKHTSTRLRWYAGKDMSTMNAGSMMSITPDFEISKSSGSAKGYIGGTEISVSGHSHDDRYYTESEIDNKLSGKAASSHTHNYAGSSSAGGAANTAVGVVDYGNTSKTIKIGFSGASATTSNLAYIAGYLSGGTQIKDVSKDTLKSWLGLGSAAYTNSSAYAAASHSHSYLPLSGGTLNGDVYSNNWIYTSHFSASTGNLYLTAGANESTARTLKLAADNGTEVLNKVCNNYKSITASAFTQASSRLIKENINDIADEEAKKILDLKPVSFDYKEKFGGKKNQYGLIAEEVLELIPYCVNVPSDYSESDFDEEKGIDQPILSLDYSKLIPYLIKMIQIQQNEIDELKQMIK